MHFTKVAVWAKVADFSKIGVRFEITIGRADGSGGEVRRLQTSAARLAISAMANSMRSSSLFHAKTRIRRVSSNIASMQSSRSKDPKLGYEHMLRTWP